MNVTKRDGTLMTFSEGQQILQSKLDPYYVHTYIPVGTTTTKTLLADTPTKVTLDVTPKEGNGFSLVDLGGGETALQLDGNGEDVDILFSLEGSSSITTSVNNPNVTFMLYKNGVYEPGNIITRKVGTGADQGALALTGTFRGNPSAQDQFEVYVESDLATDVNFIKTSIVIEEVKVIG